MSTLADDLTTTLQRWTPSTSSQECLRQAYLALLLTNAASLWKPHVAGHFTVGALVLDATSTHVLLVLHPKAGMWLPPGGHLEPDDTSVLQAARREVREETGLDDLVADDNLVLDVHPFTCRPGLPSRHLNLGFVLRTPAAADGQLPAVTISEESLDVRWWPVDQLPTPVPPRLAEELALARQTPTPGAASHAPR